VKLAALANGNGSLWKERAIRLCIYTRASSPSVRRAFALARSKEYSEKGAPFKVRPAGCLGVVEHAGKTDEHR